MSQAQRFYLIDVTVYPPRLRGAEASGYESYEAAFSDMERYFKTGTIAQDHKVLIVKLAASCIYIPPAPQGRVIVDPAP